MLESKEEDEKSKDRGQGQSEILRALPWRRGSRQGACLGGEAQGWRRGWKLGEGLGPQRSGKI